MKRIYTGIGSRDVPPGVYQLCERLAYKLAQQGYTLRTGGAHGCDEAFLSGARAAGGDVELYLPEPGYNKHKRSVMLSQATPEAHDLAADIIGPSRWSHLGPFSMLAHARNMHAVLGAELNAPSEFVVCWTRNPSKGGTRIGIACAKRHNVPTYNIASTKSYNELCQILLQGELAL